MGTRHLTIVKIGGKTKISQYGQWDGYPSGQGVNVLDFLQNRCDIEKFKEQVTNLVDITREQLSEKFTNLIGEDKDWITIEESKLIEDKYPEFHRNTGSDILDLVHKKGVTLVDVVEDSSWCEWTYTIDFDKNKLIVGIGKDYDFDLSDLPTEEQFLGVLENPYVLTMSKGDETEVRHCCDEDEVNYFVEELELSDYKFVKVEKYCEIDLTLKQIEYVV